MIKFLYQHWRCRAVYAVESRYRATDHTCSEAVRIFLLDKTPNSTFLRLHYYCFCFVLIGLVTNITTVVQ